jgi:hypothetical protein
VKAARLLIYAGALALLGTVQGFGMGVLPIDTGGSGVSRSAPGPVIGLGVPAVIALGGYVWYRRRHGGK